MRKPQSIQSLEARNIDYQQSIENPEAFWGDIAEQFTWQRKWDRVLDWNFEEPRVRWFDGAQLNITENCLDRHLVDKAEDLALIWESNDPTEPSKSYSYRELHEAVCIFAQALRN